MKEISQRTFNGLVSVILFLVTFTWFLIDGGMIETGGDAMGRWENIIAYVVNEESLGFGHHGLRWGINLPIVFLLKFAPFFHPVFYHLVMPLFGAGTAVLIYLTVQHRSQNISSDVGCAALVLALITIDFSERPFSQLLPSGAAIFYMCAAIFFLRLALTPSKKIYPVWYLLASLSILLAYGAKLTMVFFGIPISLFVVLRCFLHREFTNLGAFIFPLVLGLFVETLFVALGSGHLYGRIFAVMGTAGSHGDAVRSILAGASVDGWGFNNFSDYLLLSPLKYYEAIGKYSFVIYISVLYIIATKIRCWSVVGKHRFKNCLAWTIIGFFVLQTYVIVGVAPYVFPEKYIHARYQYPLFVLCSIFLFFSIVEVVQKYSSNGNRQSSKLLFSISMFVLIGSLFFNTNNIFSKHNNFGILVTLIHNEVLTDWISSGGNIGYHGRVDSAIGEMARLKSLDNSPNSKIIHNYVGSIYQLDYCRRDEAYVYASVDRIFGLCNRWKPGELVLFYYATSYEWRRPEGLQFLGKYSSLVGSE